MELQLASSSHSGVRFEHTGVYSVVAVQSKVTIMCHGQSAHITPSTD